MQKGSLVSYEYRRIETILCGRYPLTEKIFSEKASCITEEIFWEKASCVTEEFFCHWHQLIVSYPLPQTIAVVVFRLAIDQPVCGGAGWHLQLCTPQLLQLELTTPQLHLPPPHLTILSPPHCSLWWHYSRVPHSYTTPHSTILTSETNRTYHHQASKQISSTHRQGCPDRPTH